jgi:hypothetical protein
MIESTWVQIIMQNKSWCGVVLMLQHFTLLLSYLCMCEANFKLSCIVQDVTSFFMPKDGGLGSVHIRLCSAVRDQIPKGTGWTPPMPLNPYEGQIPCGARRGSEEVSVHETRDVGQFPVEGGRKWAVWTGVELRQGLNEVSVFGGSGSLPGQGDPPGSSHISSRGWPKWTRPK